MPKKLNPVCKSSDESQDTHSFEMIRKSSWIYVAPLLSESHPDKNITELVDTQMRKLSKALLTGVIL